MAKTFIKKIGLVVITFLGLAFPYRIYGQEGTEVIGNIGMPEHLSGYGSVEGEGGDGGMVGLISNIIRIFMVIAGLWSFINLLLAGFAYVTSGDKPDAIKSAGERIYMSLIGLVIIVGSFVMAALIGQVLYGNPGAILQPKLYGPGITASTP